MKTSLLPYKATARDLLVYVAGAKHQDHGIVARTKEKKDSIRFACSCGDVFEIEATFNNKAAIRNVAERPVRVPGVVEK